MKTLLTILLLCIFSLTAICEPTPFKKGKYYTGDLVIFNGDLWKVRQDFNAKAEPYFGSYWERIGKYIEPKIIIDSKKDETIDSLKEVIKIMELKLTKKPSVKIVKDENNEMGFTIYIDRN